ncbi:metallophosphatase [Devosia pacifica]|uniref:Metallophosphatase n=1 Tax=Devosia pacifica TaxID=1335967 RepID=A0A918SAN8_9HYPH|nr:ligase-associated DNA damage response endonuclease PdeM [Devosia pacifica]GHA31360.1 metallophosphatase [Devosia pacifica]
MTVSAVPIQGDAHAIAFSGERFVAQPSGALYWPSRNALLVADLHFEKMSSFARHGQMLPPYDTGMTLNRLTRDVDSTGAQLLIALGDSFHRNEGVGTLQDVDRARLDALTDRLEWIWLSGNHDPAPHKLAGRCLPYLELDGLWLTHEPRRGRPGLVAGHLHPAARVLIGGRSQRRPCFVHDQHLMVMPAYGASTGTLNILSAAFEGLLDRTRLAVAMLGRERVYPVHPGRLVDG